MVCCCIRMQTTDYFKYSASRWFYIAMSQKLEFIWKSLFPSPTFPFLSVLPVFLFSFFFCSFSFSFALGIPFLSCCDRHLVHPCSIWKHKVTVLYLQWLYPPLMYVMRSCSCVCTCTHGGQRLTLDIVTLILSTLLLGQMLWNIVNLINWSTLANKMPWVSSCLHLWQFRLCPALYKSLGIKLRSPGLFYKLSHLPSLPRRFVLISLMISAHLSNWQIGMLS